MARYMIRIAKKEVEDEKIGNDEVERKGREEF